METITTNFIASVHFKTSSRRSASVRPKTDEANYEYAKHRVTVAFEKYVTDWTTGKYDGWIVRVWTTSYTECVMTDTFRLREDAREYAERLLAHADSAFATRGDEDLSSELRCSRHDLYLAVMDR